MYESFPFLLIDWESASFFFLSRGHDRCAKIAIPNVEMPKAKPGSSLSIPELVAQLKSKSQYDRATSLAALLQHTHDSTGANKSWGF